MNDNQAIALLAFGCVGVALIIFFCADRQVIVEAFNAICGWFHFGTTH